MPNFVVARVGNNQYAMLNQVKNDTNTTVPPSGELNKKDYSILFQLGSKRPLQPSKSRILEDQNGRITHVSLTTEQRDDSILQSPKS